MAINYCQEAMQFAPIPYAYITLFYNNQGILVDIMFLDINKSFENMTGLSKDIFINLKITETAAIDADETDRWIQFFKNALQPKEISEIIYFSKTLGKHFTVTLHSPKKDYIYAYFKDITEQKDEKNLRKLSHERLEFALDSGNLAIWDWDMQSNTLFFSDRYSTMLGYHPGELPMEVDTWINLLHPDDLELIAPLIQEYVNKAQQYQAEFRLKCKSGIYKWISAHGKFFKDASGKPIRAVGIHADIDQQKRSNDKLLKLHAILDASPTVAYLTNCQMGMTEEYISSNIERIFGYQAEDFLSGLITFPEIIHPDDKARVLAKVEQSINIKAESYRQEPYRLITKDGSIHWVDDRTSLRLDTHGSVTHLQGVILDITEQMKDQVTIREQQERFRVIFENSPQPICVTSIDTGVFVNANNSFCKLAEASKEDLIGKSSISHHIFTQEDRELFITKLKLSGSADGMKLHAASLKGKQLLLKIFSRIISINSKEYILTIIDDITQKTAADEQIKKFMTIAENALYGVIITNRHGTIEYINNYFADIHGYRKDQLISKNISLMHNEEQMVDVKRILDNLYQGKSLSGLELWHTHKNGLVFPMLMSAVYIENEDNQSGFIAATAIDISEQKQQENELIWAKDRAEQANKAKSEFIANMSHEIRTPLNAIIGFTELLEHMELPPIQKQYLKNIHSSAHSLLGIISNILDFSKLDTGQIVLKPIQTDISSILESTIDLVKYQASGKGLELLLDIDTNVPRFIILDPLRVKQIMLNLLNNAIKFTSEGEVLLKANFNAASQESGCLTVSVTDTGIGIPAEKQSKIFKAFSQVDGSSTRHFGGTGLGLIISELLAKMMNSKIELESTLGKGSSFSFSINCKTPYGYKRDFNFTKIHKVLITDDNLRHCHILSRILKQWKIQTTLTCSGGEALSVLNSHDPFDVLIIDESMPEYSGIETARTIRRQLQFSSDTLPIIMMSNSYAVDFQTECAKLEIVSILQKPVKQNDIGFALSEIDVNRR